MRRGERTPRILTLQVCIAMLVQTCNRVMPPKNGHVTGYSYWKQFHHSVGYASVILADFTCLYACVLLSRQPA
jgi:hypothetical protein